MDINEVADKVMAILRKLKEDTRVVVNEEAQLLPEQLEQPKELEKQTDV